MCAPLACLFTGKASHPPHLLPFPDESTLPLLTLPTAQLLLNLPAIAFCRLTDGTRITLARMTEFLAVVVSATEFSLTELMAR